MTPVATLANDYITSSNAATATVAPAHVAYLGAVSTRPADPIATAPETGIDYDAGVAAFLAAPTVEEYASSPVSTKSPFGI